MAHFSELKDGSGTNKVEIHRGCRNDGFFVNPNLYVKFEGGDEFKDTNRLRSLFDQILSFFLKKVVNKYAIRPLPPKLGDGEDADLFKLFMVVKKIGDYESVSKNEMWEFVAEECGLDFELVASLKLIYVKYLKEFDQWLTHGEFKDKNFENSDIDFLEKLISFSRELEGHRGSFSSGKEKAKMGTFKFAENVCGMEVNKAKNELGLSKTIDDEKLCVKDDKRIQLSPENIVRKVGVSRINDDDDENFNVKNVVLGSHFDNNVIYRDENDVSISAKKRKREEGLLTFSKMVDWVTNAARDPHDIAIRTLPNSSKWKKYKSDEMWKQVLLARDALFMKRNVDSCNEETCSQKKNPRMHPSMYEDNKSPIDPSSERARCRQRVTSLKSCFCPGCISRSSSCNKRQKPEPEKSQIPEKVKVHDICQNPESTFVNLGPRFQAEVPEWTGEISDSDPKWLGDQMWAPPKSQSQTYEMDLEIGKGREDSCECLFRGSADCVRFHVAENRLKVKIALGPLFYKWKFNHMGEEASLSWSLEEEKVFRILVLKARQDLEHESKSRQEIMNRFWRRASEALPAKTKEKVVNFYFNVYVLRRRSYQNRVTPEDIDSDDDESEVGSVGDRFGYEKIHGLSVKCSENKQCTDLEF